MKLETWDWILDAGRRSRPKAGNLEPLPAMLRNARQAGL